MKKALIAGAASAMLAAMPVVGVFAVDPISVGNNGSLTDNFTVTIEHSCSMSRKTGAEHTAGASSTNWNTPYADSDTLALGTITAGAIYSLGSSTFNVKCNGTSGYEVKAVVTNFAGPGASNVDDINAVSAAISAVPTGSSTWTAVSSYNTVYATSTSTGDTVMANDDATANAGDDFTMTYTLGLKDGQASGSYTANVAYTLVDLTSNS